MKQPLILILYEKMIPGTQLVNRLQDLGYAVRTVAEPGTLLDQAERDKPMLVIADLEPHPAQMCQAIAQVRNNPATNHLPIIALTGGKEKEREQQARNAGASLVVYDHVILLHLNQFLEQALQVD